MKKIKSINKKWQKFLISESGFGEQIIQEGPTDKPAHFMATVAGPKKVTKKPNASMFRPTKDFGSAKPVALYQATDPKDKSKVYYLGQKIVKPRSNVWVYVMAGPYTNGLSNDGLTGLLADFSVILSRRADQPDVQAELENRGFINQNAKTTPVNFTPPPKGSTIRQTPSNVNVNDSKPKAGSWFRTGPDSPVWRLKALLGNNSEGQWYLSATSTKSDHRTNSADLKVRIMFRPKADLSIESSSSIAAQNNSYIDSAGAKLTGTPGEKYGYDDFALQNSNPSIAMSIEYPLDAGVIDTSEDVIAKNLRSGAAIKALGQRMVAHYTSFIPELPGLGGGKAKAIKTKVPKGKPAKTRSTRRRRSTTRGFTAYHIRRQKQLLRTELQGLTMKGLQGLLWIAAKALKMDPRLGTTGIDMDGDGTGDGVDGQYYTKTYNLITRLQKKFFGKTAGTLKGEFRGRDNIDGLVGLGTLAKLSELFKISGSGSDAAEIVLQNTDLSREELSNLVDSFKSLESEIPEKLLSSIPKDLVRVITQAGSKAASGVSVKKSINLSVKNIVTDGAKYESVILTDGQSQSALQAYNPYTTSDMNVQSAPKRNYGALFLYVKIRKQQWKQMTSDVKTPESYTPDIITGPPTGPGAGLRFRVPNSILVLDKKAEVTGPLPNKTDRRAIDNQAPTRALNTDIVDRFGSFSMSRGEGSVLFDFKFLETGPAAQGALDFRLHGPFFPFEGIPEDESTNPETTLAIFILSKNEKDRPQGV